MKTPFSKDEFLSAKDAAIVLRMSRKSFYDNVLNKKLLKPYKFEQFVRLKYKRSDVLALLKPVELREK